MADPDATETGNELSQPKFEFKGLEMTEEKRRHIAMLLSHLLGRRRRILLSYSREMGLGRQFPVRREEMCSYHEEGRRCG